MNNSVYDKKMENLRKRVKFELLNNSKDYKKSGVGQALIRRRYLGKILLLFMRLNQL